MPKYFFLCSNFKKKAKRAKKESPTDSFPNRDLSIRNGADGLTPISLSNVCAYPQIACATALPNTMNITDAPIDLGVNLISTGSPNFVPLGGFPKITVNGVETNTFDPSSSFAQVGNNTILMTYDFVGGTGDNGTIANPALPLDLDGDINNGVCPVSLPAKTIVIAEPIPMMSQWGLIIFGLLILNLAIGFVHKKTAIEIAS